MDFAPKDIKAALAAQIRAYIIAQGGRDITVRSKRRVTEYPCVTMYLDDITMFTTHGPDGGVKCRGWIGIHVETSADDDDEDQMDDFIAIGTGHKSSICDAVNSDHTLSGAVESITLLEVGAPVHADTADGATEFVSWCPFEILTRKTGARA